MSEKTNQKQPQFVTQCIPYEDITRMFPYEFWDELKEVAPFRGVNPVLLIDYVPNDQPLAYLGEKETEPEKQQKERMTTRSHEALKKAFNTSRDMAKKLYEKNVAETYQMTKELGSQGVGSEQDAINLQIDPYNNNLVELDHIGDVLLLDLCYLKKDLDRVTQKGSPLNKPNVEPINPLKTPTYQVFVQYYDSAKQPVFAEGLSHETLSKIPEILWDDPSLLIAYTELNEAGTLQLSIVTAPDFILERLQNTM